MQHPITTSLLAIALLTACGDDEGGQDPSGTSDAPTTDGDDTTGSDSESVDSTGVGTTAPTTAVETSDTEGTDTTNATETTADDTTGGDMGEYAALVRGGLFTDDLEQAQALHDMIAQGGKAGAMALGDFGHEVGLGTALLGTTPNEFVAVDRWTSLEGAVTLYSDPAYQRAFSMLFAEPVMPELFERRTDWHGWGDLDVSDDLASYAFVVVRGRLASEDLGEAQALHDQIAAGAQEPATMLGDIAHVVWLGADDPGEFFAIDVWTASDNIEMFYSDPAVQEAFGALFVEAPSIGVYDSTQWYQW